MAAWIDRAITAGKWIYETYKDYHDSPTGTQAKETSTDETTPEVTSNISNVTSDGVKIQPKPGDSAKEKSAADEETPAITISEDTQEKRQSSDGGVEMRTKPKGNTITNDTNKSAIITLKRRSDGSDTLEQKLNLLPHCCIPVGEGDGKDFMTAHLMENKVPTHMAAENMPLKVGESYILVWCNDDGIAGILLRKRRDPTMYYSVCGDKNFRNAKTQAVEFEQKSF